MSTPPRNAAKRSTFDELTDDPIAFFGLIALGLLVLPGVIPGVRDAAVTWLLEHHLVVPAVEASLTIPLTSVGLDARRIVVAVLVALAVVSLLAWLRSRRSRSRGGQS